MQRESETPLAAPPGDGISAVKFAPSSDLLLASSWDCTARLYDARGNAALGVFKSTRPVLDIAFMDNTQGFFGGLDNAVNMFDFAGAGGVIKLGSHTAPVRALEYQSGAGHDMLLSGSWDSIVKAWDHRAPSFLVADLPMPGKVFALAFSGHKIVVGCSGSNRPVVILDARALGQPLQTRESSLKYQTRAIKLMPDSTGYVLSSVEGRVAVEYFDPSPEVQAKKYAFKCHRQGGNVYPVNAMAFHPQFGTFATGGCDGTVNMWDGTNKKRLVAYPAYPSSIAGLAFNHDGSMLAVASSYTFEEGEKDMGVPDEIYIRQVNPADVRPKPRRPAA